MISDTHKFIFVHIIKTGGTSIERFFKKGGGTKHQFAKKYKEQVDNKKWEDYFKFTFVRNPWDKMVSQYFYIQRNNNGNYHLTFREFILAFESCPETDYIDGIGIPVKFNPIQSPWIYDDMGNCMVDFVGRFENYERDFNVICDKIRIPHQKLPYYNTSDHKHYSEYYDKDTQKIIEEKFANDIKHFGYEFGQ